MVVDEKIMKYFRVFLDSIDFTYTSRVKTEFDEFKKRAGLVDTGDTSVKVGDKPDYAWTEKETAELRSIAGQVEKILSNEGTREFEKSVDEIKKFIKDALIVRDKGQDDDVVFRLRLGRDVQVAAAMKLLLDTKTYHNLLSPKLINKK
jgi:hypothetical protein